MAASSGPLSSSRKTLKWSDVPAKEFIADFSLAVLSRAIDERGLTLYKQGRTFFHIAGAGPESLLTGLARSLRAGYDWFFPYYRDLALVLSLAVTPNGSQAA
jgi:2-oxoisovalerate dehydrogenase E1 component